MFATDHDSKHLLRVSLATCQLPAFEYVRLRIDSSASRQVQYLMHTFEWTCPKPIKTRKRKGAIKPLRYYCFLCSHIYIHWLDDNGPWSRWTVDGVLALLIWGAHFDHHHAYSLSFIELMLFNMAIILLLIIILIFLLCFLFTLDAYSFMSESIIVFIEEIYFYSCPYNHIFGNFLLFSIWCALFECIKAHQNSFTFRSFRQVELSLSNKTRSAQPMRAIGGLGTSVMANAGFGWSGLFARRTGDVCVVGWILRPKPKQYLKI